MQNPQSLEDWIAALVQWVFANAAFVDVAVLVGIAALIFQMRGLVQTARADQSRFYLEIAQRWTDILKLLYHVRNNPPPDLATLQAQYPDPKLFMQTPEWQQTYRPICNFYEDVGLMVKTGNLSIKELTVLVTIIDSDYLLLKPVISYLREKYRPDIYIFWNYILERAAKRNAVYDPFRGRKPYEPAVPKPDQK